MNLNDQTRSVYRMLWELFAAERTAGLRIELQRVPRMVRPQMRLERLMHREVDFGRGIYRDDCQFAITYNGTNRQDTELVVSKIRQYITNGGNDYSNVNLIQGWRFGWIFPQPFVETRADGTIDAGDHTVRVSGIDICGNESAASAPLTVTLDGTQSLHVRIPRVPWNHPLFPHYEVYVDGFREATVDMPQWGYPEITISSLMGTGVTPKEFEATNGDQTTIRWKWLRVTNLTDTIREDAIEAGRFQATITLETSFIQPRGIPQTEIIEQISTTVTLEV